MKNKYRSMQISKNGESYIVDYEANTKAEIWDKVNDQGSRWIFYPLPFVVMNKPNMNFKNMRILSAPDGFEFLENKTIRNAMQWIESNPDIINLKLNL